MRLLVRCSRACSRGTRAQHSDRESPSRLRTLRPAPAAHDAGDFANNLPKGARRRVGSHGVCTYASHPLSLLPQWRIYDDMNELTLWSLGTLAVLGAVGWLYWRRRRRLHKAVQDSSNAARTHSQRATGAPAEAWPSASLRREGQHRVEAVLTTRDCSTVEHSIARQPSTLAGAKGGRQFAEPAATAPSSMAEHAPFDRAGLADSQALAAAAGDRPPSRQAAPRLTLEPAVLPALSNADSDIHPIVIAQTAARPPIALEHSIDERQVKPQQRHRNQARVLVVDDSRLVRVKTGRLLSQQGYVVVEATDGLDALRQLQACAPELVITDVEMPGLDGFGLTRRLRADPCTARIPVIMITAADERHRVEAADAGVDTLLGKPYADAELIAHASRLLEADMTAVA